MQSFILRTNKPLIRSVLFNIDRLLIIVPCTLLFLIVLHLTWFNAMAQTNTIFQEIEIQEPYRNMLLQDPEFMQETGARFFTNNREGLALIGIGKVTPKDKHAETMLYARRIGEIRARIAILEMRDGIKVSTSRGLKECISLSSFFQVTETRVEGEIQQLPVIGTWWAPKCNIFYVAVGKMIDSAEEVIREINHKDMLHIKGEEPFLSLLQISPVLCRNGGVRGFLFGKNNKVLVSVASALLKGSRAKTERIAQLKAIRFLLGHRKGLHLSSVEYLSDQEHLGLTGDEKKHVLLSQFLSVQEEKVSGIIKSLPIVATWKDPKGQILYVAIGKLFD